MRLLLQHIDQTFRAFLPTARFGRSLLDISAKVATARPGWRRFAWLLISGYLSLIEGAMTGAAVAGLIALGGLGFQNFINESGIVWVEVLTRNSVVYLVTFWAVVGALVAAILEIL